MIPSAYLRIRLISGIIMLLAMLTQPGQLPASENLPDNADDYSLEQALLENLPPELAQPDAEDWQLFWNQIEIILQSQSLDDMIWFRSIAQQACDYLDADTTAQPWADWLRQRLDYFEMASMAVREIPSAPAVSPTDTPSRQPSLPPVKSEVKSSPSASPKVASTARKAFQLVMPKTPPPKIQVSLQVETRRHSLIRNSSRWRKKLANRPAPPNAAALIPRLKKVFRSEGLPPELVWMAEVESSLNPAARSPVGALGLFQLMPATARRFGLRTGFFDERKDPEKNARAAAQYLKFLYNAMGSWPLALAAYNAGEGRVGKLIKHNKQNSFEGIADDLPLETQMYVPKVMALVSLRESTAPEKLPAPVVATSFCPVLFNFEPLAALAKDCTEQFDTPIYACNSEPNLQNAQVYWPSDLLSW